MFILFKDMNNVSITNDNVGVNNLHNYCSIPGCNINEYTKDIGSETLYRPDNVIIHFN